MPRDSASEPADRRRAESYSTLEVARLLQVTVQTVQRWVDAGHLKAWRTVGGHRRIDADSVQQFRASSGLVSEAVEVEDNAAPAPAAATSAGPLVLVVDDDPGDRELMAYLLRRLRPDWRVKFAENGFAALLAIGKEPPDVLITDVAMPYLNGPAMLRTLFESTEHEGMAILAVSSHSTSEIAALGGLPPGVAFLHKPVNRKALERFLAGVSPGSSAPSMEDNA